MMDEELKKYLGAIAVFGFIMCFCHYYFAGTNDLLQFMLPTFLGIIDIPVWFYFKCEKEYLKIFLVMLALQVLSCIISYEVLGAEYGFYATIDLSVFLFMLFFFCRKDKFFYKCTLNLLFLNTLICYLACTVVGILLALVFVPLITIINLSVAMGEYDEKLRKESEETPFSIEPGQYGEVDIDVVDSSDKSLIIPDGACLKPVLPSSHTPRKKIKEVEEVDYVKYYSRRIAGLVAYVCCGEADATEACYDRLSAMPNVCSRYFTRVYRLQYKKFKTVVECQKNQESRYDILETLSYACRNNEKCAADFSNVLFAGVVASTYRQAAFKRFVGILTILKIDDKIVAKYKGKLR